MSDTNNGIVGSKTSQEDKQKTKLVRFLALFSLVGGIQVATQYFAHMFNYQSQLGAHFNHLYPPWAIIGWGNQWVGQYPDSFSQAAGAGLLFASIGLITALIVKSVAANSSRSNSHLHGSARWANRKDISAARLLPQRPSWFKRLTSQQNVHDDFVYVGAWQDPSGKTHYLKHNGPEHVLCYAPTRSGKGVGLV